MLSTLIFSVLITAVIVILCKHCGKKSECFCQNKAIHCANVKLLALPHFPAYLRQGVKFLNLNRNLLLELDVNGEKWPSLREISVESNPFLECEFIRIPTRVRLRGKHCPQNR